MLMSFNQIIAICIVNKSISQLFNCWARQTKCVFNSINQDDWNGENERKRLIQFNHNDHDTRAF